VTDEALRPQAPACSLTATIGGICTTISGICTFRSWFS